MDDLNKQNESPSVDEVVEKVKNILTEKEAAAKQAAAEAAKAAEEAASKAAEAAVENAAGNTSEVLSASAAEIGTAAVKTAAAVEDTLKTDTDALAGTALSDAVGISSTVGRKHEFKMYDLTEGSAETSKDSGDDDLQEQAAATDASAVDGESTDSQIGAAPVAGSDGASDNMTMSQEEIDSFLEESSAAEDFADAPEAREMKRQSIRGRRKRQLVLYRVLAVAAAAALAGGGYSLYRINSGKGLPGLPFASVNESVPETVSENNINGDNTDDKTANEESADSSVTESSNSGSEAEDAQSPAQSPAGNVSAGSEEETSSEAESASPAKDTGAGTQSTSASQSTQSAQSSQSSGTQSAAAAPASQPAQSQASTPTQTSQATPTQSQASTPAQTTQTTPAQSQASTPAQTAQPASQTQAQTTAPAQAAPAQTAQTTPAQSSQATPTQSQASTPAQTAQPATQSQAQTTAPAQAAPAQTAQTTPVQSQTSTPVQNTQPAVQNTPAPAQITALDIAALAPYRDTLPYGSVSDASTKVLTNEIGSTFAVLVNADTNKVIAWKNGVNYMNPSSMSKILTILIACEKMDPNTVVTVPQSVVNYCRLTGISAVGFEGGEQVTVRDLLYGTMLASGADSAMTLAAAIGGSEAGFAQIMNARLEELGLSNTAHFSNSVGLYQPGHFCSPYDIAVIMEAALSNPVCREVLTAQQYTTTASAQHPAGIELTNAFMEKTRSQVGGNGVLLSAKNGYVKQSGCCAVSAYQGTDGQLYICVTGNATSYDNAGLDHAYLYKNLVP